MPGMYAVSGERQGTEACPARMGQTGEWRNMSEGRKKSGMMEAGLLLVILASVCYILLLAGGDPEVFLIDDNRTQWYPVMERAYEDFWTAGRVYCYDFYQMKGMSVAKQGYYGVMNPFILISYTLTGILPGGIDAITFYIGLMVVLGNFFFYLTCRQFGCKQVSAFLLTLIYSTMGCFFAFFVWYYVFNNYFLVPLLIYTFLRCTREGRLMYCACGIVLAMDMWMGNVQYTFYHYMLFGTLCLTMMILKGRRYFKILCANVSVGVGLSMPMLMLLMQASGSFQKRDEFMVYPIPIFSLLIHSLIPQGILRSHGDGISFLDSFVMGRSDNLVCYCGVVGIALFAVMLHGVGCFLKRAGEVRHLRELWEVCRAGYEKASGWPHEKKTAAGCAAALLFFLSLMNGGAVAYLLSVMPVVSNFRYLFKAIFPAAPLAVLLLAYLAGAADCKRTAGIRGDGISECENGAGNCGDRVYGSGNRSVIHENRTGRRLRLVAGLLAAVCICVGTVNARDTVILVREMFDMRVEGTFAKEKEIALTALTAADVDGKNYRTAAFLQFPGVNDECFALSRNLTRNFSTAVGVFSLAGYEAATEQSRMEMFDAIYSTKNDYAVFANADMMDNFRHRLLDDPQRVEKQLIDNSVRYLLLDKTVLADNKMARTWKDMSYHKDRREDVIAALRTLPNLRVERVCSFNDSYDLVVIAGVDSLCMDGAGNKVPLTDENMQTLSFEGKAAQEYMISFAWDRYLKAYVTEADGTVRQLPVEETENGHIRLSTAKSAGGRVTLTWQNPLCTAGFVWEGVAALAFLTLLAALALSRQKCYSI